jgi:hypothetical protein
VPTLALARREGRGRPRVDPPSVILHSHSG